MTAQGLGKSDECSLVRGDAPFAPLEEADMNILAHFLKCILKQMQTTDCYVTQTKNIQTASCSLTSTETFAVLRLHFRSHKQGLQACMNCKE